MALNIQTFKTRALTALLFVAVMGIGLLWDRWSFLILVTVIHFGCWYEYLKLVEKIYNTNIDVIIKWLFAICGFTSMIVFGLQNNSIDFWKEIGGYNISFKISCWILLFVCLMTVLVRNRQISTKVKWMGVAGLIYISLSFTLFLNLRDKLYVMNEEFVQVDAGQLYVCGIVFSIWINDTMAYLVGSFIGKTSLTKISPKKTWEGTIGGAVLCMVVIALFGYYIPVAKVFSVMHWISIAALCALFGTLGDLFESKLKRMADVKDSGSFMPGHGGFLDRFDSLLFAVPAVWIYVQLFLK